MHLVFFVSWHVRLYVHADTGKCSIFLISFDVNWDSGVQTCLVVIKKRILMLQIRAFLGHFHLPKSRHLKKKIRPIRNKKQESIIQLLNKSIKSELADGPTRFPCLSNSRSRIFAWLETSCPLGYIFRGWISSSWMVTLLQGWICWEVALNSFRCSSNWLFLRKNSTFFSQLRPHFLIMSLTFSTLLTSKRSASLRRFRLSTFDADISLRSFFKLSLLLSHWAILALTKFSICSSISEQFCCNASSIPSLDEISAFRADICGFAFSKSVAIIFFSRANTLLKGWFEWRRWSITAHALHIGSPQSQ